MRVLKPNARAIAARMRAHAAPTFPARTPLAAEPDDAPIRSIAPGDGTPASLGMVVESFEKVRRLREETGVRIRRVVEVEEAADGGDCVLRLVDDGEPLGPLAFLGRVYRNMSIEEGQLRREALASLAAHPAWHWLRTVEGADPMLFARLLGRLDLEKAATPSHFWSYCGLATVRGVAYRCRTCGLEVAAAETARVDPGHVALVSRAQCEGVLERAAANAEIRVAQPKPRQGEPCTYDADAKELCFRIGLAFVDAEGPYRRVYAAERAELQAGRPGWTDQRRHLAALRKVQKQFLTHLWQAWREGVHLPAHRAPEAIAR
jgi:hypothetical protein